MTIIRTAKRMAATSQRLRQRGKRIGLVPTMGALHEGHASLIRAAAAQNDVVIVTVFVNPKQFGPQEDFRRYPRTLSADVKLSKAAGAQIVFAPSTEQIYPKGFQTMVRVGPLAERWEGSSRPGHFDGVATVVAVLFELTRPTNAYFGQKDYQQSLVIEQMIRDLHLPIRFHRMATVREPDGLAMSSRNAYLSDAERRASAVIPRAMEDAAHRITRGERDAAMLTDGVRRTLSEVPGARIDYVALVDAKTLAPVWRLRGRVALLIAVWIGRTRLIDNLLVDVS